MAVHGTLSRPGGSLFLRNCKKRCRSQADTHNGFDACTISRTNGRGTRLPAVQNLLLRVLGEKKAAALYTTMVQETFSNL